MRTTENPHVPAAVFMPPAGLKAPYGWRWLQPGDRITEKTMLISPSGEEHRGSVLTPGRELAGNGMSVDGIQAYYAEPVETKPAPEKKAFVSRFPLPRFVVKVTHLHEAWVVGSAADPAKDPAETRDIDVIVPFSHWAAAALLIPADAKPTMFGGWKFTTDGREVDMWPGDIAWLMTNHKAHWAWQPKHGIRLEKTHA